MLFMVIYGSPLSKLDFVYGSPLPSFYGLRKLTSGIKSLAEVDFRFVIYVSLKIYPSINTKNVYTHGKHGSNNTKNEKLQKDMITC